MDELEKTMKKLDNPVKIQDFLDKIPFNFEKGGETYMSPKRMLKRRRAHCLEGALFACLCLERLGIPNYLLDLKVKDLRKDSDHTVCLFKMNGYWGAISKTNHSVLRWRDPIYKSPRELALSYFHEYFLDNGEKTLKSFSKPFDVWKKFGRDWTEDEEDLDDIAVSLDRSPHFEFVPKKNKKLLRRAGKTEVKGAAVVEY